MSAKYLQLIYLNKLVLLLPAIVNCFLHRWIVIHEVEAACMREKNDSFLAHSGRSAMISRCLQELFGSGCDMYQRRYLRRMRPMQTSRTRSATQRIMQQMRGEL